MPFGIAAIIGFIVKALIAALISYAIAYLTRPDENFPEDPAYGQKVRGNTRSTQEPVRIIYGQQYVGGNDVFMESAGDDNKDMWIVHSICEGEIDSIIDLKLNGQSIYDFGTGNVEYWFHSGTDTQTVDPNLSAAIAKHTDNYRNTAYLVWKLHYDREYFNGLPKRQLEVKGLKLYDFRVGGAKVWSDNPVLCLYDYMTNTRYGLGKGVATIDTDSWGEVADYCEAKGWTLNLTIVEAKPALDIINLMARHFRGKLVWYDGKFYLKITDLNDSSNASVMDITDEHIAVDSDGRAQITMSQPPLFGRPEAMRVKFVDPDREYVVDDFIVGDELGQVNDLDLTGCTNRQQAADLAVYNLERQQLDRTVTMTGRDDCLQLEENDVVTLTSTALSLSEQVMRVTGTTIRTDGLVDLSMQYEDVALYDDDYNLNTEGTYQCALPNPNDAVPPVYSVTATESQYNERLRTYTRLSVTFTPPANYAWYDHIEVWISYDNVTFEHQFDTTADFSIEPVEEGETLYVRLKTVNIWGKKTVDAQDYLISHIVNGLDSEPSSVGSLEVVVNSNTVNLFSNRLLETDMDAYEYRVGLSWDAGIFMAQLKAPNLSLVGVKPGSHTFWLNTFRNNGIYGNSPASASAALADPPPGYTVTNTETGDYSTGTHSNTEATTYNTEEYLKCSHTGDVLTGTYKSVVFDRGAVAEYLVYCLADIVVLGGGTTWDDHFPDGTTWNQGNIDRRWMDIFLLTEAPQVKMAVNYGDAAVTENTVNKIELMTAIISGRYFQLEIEITDPSTATNALVEHFELKFAQ